MFHAGKFLQSACLFCLEYRNLCSGRKEDGVCMSITVLRLCWVHCAPWLTLQPDDTAFFKTYLEIIVLSCIWNDFPATLLFRPKYWFYAASRLHLWVEYSQEVCRILAWSLGQGVHHIFFPTTSIQASYEHTWRHPTPDAVGSHSFVNRFAISVWDAESGNWHSTVALFKVFSVTSFFFLWQLKQKGGSASLIPIISPLVYHWYTTLLCQVSYMK